jgi:predicted acyltransferase
VISGTPGASHEVSAYDWALVSCVTEAAPVGRVVAGGITSAPAGKSSVSARRRLDVIVLGVICLILGLIFGVGILWTIGLILIAVGIILAVLGMMDRAVGPRRYYW